MKLRNFYLLAYAIPAALALACFYGLLPLLRALGLADYPAFFAGMALPGAAMLAGALYIFRREGHPWTWPAFAERMRLGRLDKAGVRGLLAVLGWAVGSNLLISGLLQLGGVYRLLPMPANLPAILDPRLVPDSAMLHAAWGGDIRGQWGVLLITGLWLFIFNILGEELWWRGILLPLHEQSSGSRAWLVQGLLWTLFHVFKYWSLPVLLPVCLVIPYMAQKLKNNTPGLWAHFIINGSMLIPLTLAVLGK